MAKKLFLISALVVFFLSLFCEASVSYSSFVSSNSLSDDVKCEACQLLVEVFAKAADNVVGIAIAKAIAKKLCIAKKWEAEVVCNGAIDEFAPEFLYIAAHLAKDKRQMVCSKIKMCPATNEQENNMEVEERLLLHPKLQSFSSRLSSILQDNNRRSGNVGKFVHVTDLHVDTFYLQGTSINCGLPQCCRKENGPGVTPQDNAPKFGTLDGNCDIPLETLTSGVQSIASHNPDFVLLTGDFPPHDIWEQSQEKNIGYQREILSIFSAVLGNTSTFPVLGNHGSFPVNQFRGPGYDSWLYNASYDLWSHWLPPAVRSEIEFGGYYSTLIRPGLRAVCLNSQLWLDYSDNFWQLLPESDVWQEDQWNWLQNVFAQAHQNGERIFLLTHVPWTSVIQKYAEGFAALIQRYEGLMVASFGGHTHSEFWQIFKANDTKKPLHVHFVSPSLTTYTGLNPSYRVFSYDRTTFELVDVETYFANITLGNAQGQLTWELVYSATTAFNMTGLQAEDWQHVNDKLAVDQKLFDFYFKNFNQQQVAAPGPSRQCDAGCKKSHLCTLNSATQQQEDECNARS